MTTKQIDTIIKRDLKCAVRDITVLITVLNNETASKRLLVRGWVDGVVNPVQYFVIARYSDGDVAAYPTDGFAGGKLMLVQSL